MGYDEILEFIHGIPRFAKKEGLHRVGNLLEVMGRPQDKLKFVHVAGTNGKGSTCTMISYILKEAGYKTGLYISPFLIDFRERIQINNEMIPKKDLAEIGTYVKSIWEELNIQGEPPSEFEVIFAIALEYFVRSGTEIVVLETGMGGRLDATNIIPTPLVTVITSIGLDHTAILGETVEQIAKEKAAIIKNGTSVVCYPSQPIEALGVIMEACANTNSTMVVPNNAKIIKAGINGSEIMYGGTVLSIPLPGEHQVLNALVAIEAAKLLRYKGFAVSDSSINIGILSTVFPARMEVMCANPLVIIDGAHNLDGAKALANALKLIEGRKIHAVIGMMADKQVEEVLAELSPLFYSIVTTQEPDNSRFVTAKHLADIAGKYNDRVSYQDNPKTALQHLLNSVPDEDAVVVCGSLYLATVVRQEVEHLLQLRKSKGIS